MNLDIKIDDRHFRVLSALCVEQDMGKSAVVMAALRLYQMVHEKNKRGERMMFVEDSPLVLTGTTGKAVNSGSDHDVV